MRGESEGSTRGREERGEGEKRLHPFENGGGKEPRGSFCCLCNGGRKGKGETLASDSVEKGRRGLPDHLRDEVEKLVEGGDRGTDPPQKKKDTPIEAGRRGSSRPNTISDQTGKVTWLAEGGKKSPSPV